MATELGSLPNYPVMALLRRHGYPAALAAAAVAFALAAGGDGATGTGRVLRGLAWAAIAGVAVKNLSEINEIVAETLLPQ